MQLQFICIILDFPKFSTIIWYCCHDQSLEFCQVCLRFYPLFWKLHMFSFGASVKLLWKNVIITQTQNRDLHSDMGNQYSDSSCGEELRGHLSARDMVDAFFIISPQLRMLCFNIISPIAPLLSPAIYFVKFQSHNSGMTL